MPAPLQFKRQDPNEQGRGGGVYYRRGNYKKGKRLYNDWFSKFDLERDRKKKSKGYSVSKIGLPKRSRILHSSDGRLPR